MKTPVELKINRIVLKNKLPVKLVNEVEELAEWFCDNPNLDDIHDAMLMLMIDALNGKYN